MSRADVPVRVSTIAAGKFRRYAHLTLWQHLTNFQIVSNNIIDTVKITIGFLQSIVLLLRVRPDVVFAKGGYVCLPLGIAAKLLGHPLVIHDSDTRPGLTNRLLARYATTIATGSPLENYKYDIRKSHYVGVPIGPEFTPIDDRQQRLYKQSLGLDADLPLVVATGGGLGAHSINTAFAQAARELSAQGVAVYHVTGKKHFEDISAKVSGVPQYVAVPFVYENMHQVLGAADVVVSRTSATFLQELAGLGKAVIAVPAKHLGDQLKNAEVYRAADAALLMTDDEIQSGNNLKNAIQRLISDSNLRVGLGERLHAFARPNAAKELARLILDAVK